MEDLIPEVLKLRHYSVEYFDHEIKVEYQVDQCNQEVIGVFVPESESDPLDEVDSKKPKLRRSVSADQILITTKAQDQASKLNLLPRKPNLHVSKFISKRNKPSAVKQKPNTVPEPFKFSAVQFHRPAQPQKEDSYVFHARPAPKTTASTILTTKSFMRKDRENLPKVQESHNGNQVSTKFVELQDTKNIQIQKLVRTKIEPFSFEQREKFIQQRKEEKIKNNTENTQPNQILFKAKPATVLHKKPFKPTKGDRPLQEIFEFNLHSEKRAKERAEFERKLKEKEEKIKREQAERDKQMEMEYINIHRKKTVHKANPVKHYKPIEIQPSTKKLTSPVTPLVLKKRMTRMDN